MPEATVYNPRPTIKVDGSEDEMLHTLLQAMEMTEGEGGMSAVELRVSNLVSRPDGTAELAWEDGAKLKLGAKLEVAAGDVADPTEIFRGVITGLEAHFDHAGPPELVVLAEDALQKARMARRSKVHDQATVSGIAGDVAKQAGLSPRVTGLSDDIGTQVQLNESDLAFLRRMLARHDADVQVIENDLVVAKRTDTRRGEVELAMYGALRKVRVLADVTRQVTETTTSGWDAKQGQRVSATSTGAHTGPGAGKKGSEAVKEAIGARSEHIADLAVGTDAEAKALVDAAFDQRQRRFVVVEGQCEGDPRVRVGTHVKLTGLGPRFSNTYHVVRAIHRWDTEEGYRTEFEGECAFLGEG